MIALLAAVLGVVQLGAQVLFLRVAQPILGNTSMTAAIVLAMWLLGLALGAATARARAGIGLRTAFACGALAIGLGRLALPWVAVTLDESAGTAAVAARAVGACVVLLPIPWAFGVAFVALVRRARGSGAAGRIYGIETLGAALGAVIAGFVLPRWLGITHGLTALLGFALVAAVCAGKERPLGTDEDANTASAPAPRPRRAAIALFVSGVAVFALEWIATRIAMFFVPGLVSALSGILAGMLIGTALGGAIGAGMARRARGQPAAAFVLGAFGIAASLWTVPVLVDVLGLVPRGAGGGFPPGYEIVAGVLVGCVLTAPATCASAVAFALLSTRGARDAGGSYVASCIGSTLGVVLAALDVPVFQTNVDLRAQAAWCGGLLLLAALCVAANPRAPRFAVPMVAAGIALWFVPRDQPLLASTTFFRAAQDRRIVETKQDAEVVASVVEFSDGSRALYTNAFFAAGTGPQYGYMRMLGHLPMLLARGTDASLVIALGTGTTAGAIRKHRSDRLDIVDVSRAVFGLASEFDGTSGLFLGNGHVQFQGMIWGGSPHAFSVLADGREFVQRRGREYDVVTLEPLPPQTPAAVHFYTREFYRAALARLAPGGLVVQWIPLNCVPTPQFAVLLKSFAVECPTTWTFLFDESVVLVGANEPDARIDVARIRARIDEDVRSDLAAAHVGDVAQLLAAFVCGRDALLRACGDAEPMTDDRPSVALEFGQPNARSLDNVRANADLLAGAQESVEPWLAGADPELFVHLAAADRAEDAMLRARVEPDRAAAWVAQALAAYPDDLEAAARASHVPPRAVPKKAASDAAAVLADPHADALALRKALAAAGTDPTVDVRLVVQLLAHADRSVRLEAMVASTRRGVDLRGFDPDGDEPARAAAIARIKEGLSSRR
ncbi:MAG: hypothetical protein JNL94_04585 [Planctomycetes bacterium]|nr:hypothetical protein [Planctomycetota bacterium]